MRFVPCIFFLLAVSVDLFSAQKIDCKISPYVNDPALIHKLKGYLYTITTSSPYASNEIFHFDPIVKNNILARITTDGKCCKTMNTATIPNKDRFTYDITNDKDCAVQLSEKASLKLISTKEDKDQYCILVWTCRPSRSGVHAFCSKNKISVVLKKWISAEFKRLGLKENQVVQDQDYKQGKCFKKP